MLASSATEVFTFFYLWSAVLTQPKGEIPAVPFCFGMATKADGMSLVQLYRRMVMR